ncbi:MAG: DegT/DnrJ/EryC1/StrS family aminotransferase [Bryobacterales bacterium]|nr:DegT/DnrJ/EryC1/StrS family aminotransferase [Bryobacteraceae bacterium]MDW8130221.1 DegT/DnrJ/EryC1/StrS family aminotransferase [Bryobacterales bacterium]
MSAFSLNHFKHIECGSGGMILTDDDALRYRAALFVDKCYQREEGVRDPFFLAPNYQMTELQAAVALAQLERLPEIVQRRNRLGSRLDQALAEIPGVSGQRVRPGDTHTYFYLFRLDLEKLGATAGQFSEALSAEGIPNKAHLITGGMPVYRYRIFQQRSAFPSSTYPFGDRTYPAGLCPVADEAFERWITMDLFEHWSESDVDEIAHGIAKVAWHLARRRAAAPV